ncbi:beta-N-acetylglucosaminidase domain-containing protein [Streptomyces sp. FH025]|uniref:beta-N-acetylhexosaminidase family protein n=1 Tax=Streptomyces sp. FH025 TaxID=2815937 RepID=UPI0027DAD20B|nr:beta-N-acetylglucosaminidase domain-containing protein [Streptomyces sp. FH025]
MRRVKRAATATAVAMALGAAAACAPRDQGPPSARPATSAPSITAGPVDGPDLPEVSPTPHEIRRTGADLPVPRRVDVLHDDGADDQAVEVVTQALRAAGAEVRTARVEEQPSRQAELTLVLGRRDAPRVRELLARSGAFGPGGLPAEGYQITSGTVDGRSGMVLAGQDTAGVYYAAQTFTQLIRGRTLSGATVVDYPSIPRRGVVEGFYGTPWTQAQRLDQLAFYGRMKLNTYLYAPKDDPYERDRWREDYPAAQAAQLAELARAARENHVDFTYALSPGKSMCYSSAADRAAVTGKLRSLYQLGIRDFVMAFDDIHPLPVWSCAADLARWGPLNEQAMAAAQSELLNRLQHDFVDQHPDVRPLQMVPTQYSDLKDTPYKKTLRRTLDGRIAMMWTGADVVPTSVTVQQADDATDVWGREVTLWDNYPTNDYDHAAGRLLLAPYARRAPTLDEHLTGIVLNPMNQASASKPVLFTGADYAWNTRAYTPEAGLRAAARYLAAGDPSTTDALALFFDTQHLAPSWDGTPWQPQAPELQARIDRFQADWKAGRQQHAAQELGRYARSMAAAPQQIRDHVPDAGLAAEAKPWLDALALWGQALADTSDALLARLDGDTARAEQLFSRSRDRAGQAARLHTLPGATRPQGPVKIADGVLDTFLEQAPHLPRHTGG